MPVEKSSGYAYYQDPAWDHPGHELDKDAEINPKTGKVDHGDAALSNLFEVARAPLAALWPGETLKGFFETGHMGKGMLLDVWEIVGLPVIMAKDLVDAAVHGIAAGFSKPKTNS